MDDYILLLVCLALIIVIVVIINKKQPEDDDPVLQRLKHDSIILDPRMADKEFYVGKESYTEDKHKIFLCLKDENGNYYPYDVLIQVVIHEMAHALSDKNDPSHVTEEFKTMHDNLRNKAMKIGMFSLSDNVPPGYCVHKQH